MDDEQQIDALMEVIYDTRFQMQRVHARAKQERSKRSFIADQQAAPEKLETSPEDYLPIPPEASKVYVSHYAVGLLKRFAYQRPAIHVTPHSEGPPLVQVFGLVVSEDVTRDRAEAEADFDKIRME